MSTEELDRAGVMAKLVERRLTQRQAGELLGLTERQVRRLLRSYEAGGPAALIAKSRGRPSNRRLPDELHDRALDIVRAHYADFGPTLAREKLIERHGMSVSVETLRTWMIDAGLFVPRRRRDRRVHQPRHRRACRGELVQIDGCDHEWFEDRAPRCALLVFVDDATGELMELRFCAGESTFDYFASARRYLERHGRPVAFYSDKASEFRVNRRDHGGDGLTQFGRAMSELNIDVICAHSAPAKGRVERAHLTLQDRLVKELRLARAGSIDEGNALLPAFMADYNARFGRAPANATDAHRPLLAGQRLDDVFQRREERKVTHNLAVNYQRVLYVLEPSATALALRGKRVQVFEDDEGRVSIRHQGVELPMRAFPKDRAQNAVALGDIVDHELIGTTLDQIQRRQQEREDDPLGAILDQIHRDQRDREEQTLAAARTHRERRLIATRLHEARTAPWDEPPFGRTS
ncbi:ISNCY family transposase [Sandaracinus amylolyticus]|uniref:ISNCY family transposase n=1 Tax=Sandaracinus amylolyticus TaxID=927083 RepID=UPI001EFFCBD1|nr:ISNCY family transposase [Sandaracinus amylolyticus]UJR80510.1 Integrase catalytic region [Sandaracinus amylolyticus]